MVAYKESLNLPKTDFPMKANLSQREKGFIDFWEEKQIYNSVIEKNKKGPSFILHDGPPYANGNIHLGTTLNKVLKDIVVRYKLLRGYYSPFIPGWDCHGQPIEHEVEKRLKGKILNKQEIREECKKYALRFIDKQREQFRRLGVIGDWENPYLTMNPEYEATNIEVFGDLYKKGFVYRGKKPIYWCPNCQTALAEAEIEYHDKESHSVTVKILTDNISLKSDLPVYFLIWTTTPWTLPANVAIALKANAIYQAIKVNDEIYILAKELVGDCFKEFEPIKEFKGEELEGISYVHPLYSEKSGKAILGDFVALDQGTGVVHIAPGHGEDDYKVGLKYKLPMVMPVDEKGFFTEEAERFAGQEINKANKEIIQDLKSRNLLLRSSEATHSYPHCWRCKKPVIFRATEQWFISVEKGNFREELLKTIKTVGWIPEWSINRITAMIKDRPDWCISRQRSWGIPIPVFYCKKCGEVLINDETIKIIVELFRKEGSDSWYKKEESEILPSKIKCSECGFDEFIKETDILDVWFESGVSNFAVLKKRTELSWPADLYLEGSDQHRGWFQSSLLTSVGKEGSAPYRNVLTHGFVVDEDGRKMSKSLGNVIDPLVTISKSGADILRLWIASSDYSTDIAVSDEILKRISESYRRIRNTARFILGNLYDYNNKNDEVLYEEMLEIDRWALLQLNILIKKVTEYYESYRYHLALQSIHNFCTIELSSFYLDVLKDRLYTFLPNSLERKSAQTVLHTIIISITSLLSPTLAFTSEEIWQNIPSAVKETKSVILSDWPKINESYLDIELENKWEKIIEIRKAVLKALEFSRENKLIRNPLEAKIIIFYENKWKDLLNDNIEELPKIFIVSQVEIKPKEDFREEKSNSDIVYKDDESNNIYIVTKAKGEKCERCWNYDENLGKEEKDKKLCLRCVDVMKIFNTLGGNSYGKEA